MKTSISTRIQAVKSSEMLAGLGNLAPRICAKWQTPKENTEFDPNSGCEMLGNASRAEEFCDLDLRDLAKT